MNRKKVFMGVVGLAAAFLISALAANHDVPDFSQQSADDLYQAALMKKEAEGDLNGAIKLFQGIVTKFPGKRDIAAKAQLQIGLCYEKLGNAEARTAYERVVREFADQAEIVAQARVRLAALGGPGGAGGLVTRRILPDASGVEGVLTADGKYISHIDRGTGDVVQFEVSGGQTRRVTNKGGPGTKEAPPDSKRSHATENKSHTTGIRRNGSLNCGLEIWMVRIFTHFTVRKVVTSTPWTGRLTQGPSSHFASVTRGLN